MQFSENAILSTSYVVLLIASSVICTLGLLQDSPAIVIGGMIISPLMWPLMKISAGISLARRNYISSALFLLLISIAISLASALLITLISPLKVLNVEILSRTQPTLIDIFIALAVGVVAALAVVLKKVSANLAGVAIAASLMPPLCVGGIGLALWHPQQLSAAFFYLWQTLYRSFLFQLAIPCGLAAGIPFRERLKTVGFHTIL